jgi:septal ring factor EnvC (AmiA/AmiB activator)
MDDIVVQVKRVTDLIGEITSATLEQSSGIGQVNQAVAQLDQMTQQNAALVEQSAAAAESLREQADRLAEAVAIFKLSRQETRATIERAQASSRTRGAAPTAKTPAPKPVPSRVEGPLPKREGGDWEEF